MTSCGTCGRRLTAEEQAPYGPRCHPLSGTGHRHAGSPRFPGRRAARPAPAPAASIRTRMVIFYVVAWAPYLATLGRDILMAGRHVAVALLRRMA